MRKDESSCDAVPDAGVVIAGRYALLRHLDQGGMGAVWMAKEASTNALLAVKLLHHSLGDSKALRRFRREARALERLDAPNVVRILGHGVDGRAPFIAMELLEGETLRSLLRRHGALPPSEALRIVRQAAAGLMAAHSLGIVHRDVKPSNLFLCSPTSGETSVKVIDFGIATGDVLENDSHASSTGFIGSPAYMSPEQARAEAATQQADLWSLAVVAFQMLTGHEPFAGANVPETLQRICSGKVPLASTLASGLPANLDQVFIRAFAAKPSERFDGAAGLVAALEQACAGSGDCAAISRSPRIRAGRSDATASYVQRLTNLTRLRWLLGRRFRYRALGAAVAASVGWLLIGQSSREIPSEIAQRWSLRPALSGAVAASPPERPPEPATGPKRESDIPPNMASGPQPTMAERRMPPVRRGTQVASALPTAAQAPTSITLDPIFGLPIGKAHERESNPRSDSPASGDSELAEQVMR